MYVKRQKNTHKDKLQIHITPQLGVWKYHLGTDSDKCHYGMGTCKSSLGTPNLTPIPYSPYKTCTVNKSIPYPRGFT